MDREIKFRAWHKINKKMEYEGHNELPSGGSSYVSKTTMFMYGEDAELMQFTGLQDKNGKDIYERDVVRILYTDWPSKDANDTRTLEQYLQDIAYVGKIVFENGAFKVAIQSKMYPGEWHTTSIHPGTHGYIEVIGNQCESPELINNK